VDEDDYANDVPIAKNAGKMRKIIFFLFLALAGSSKIPTQKHARRRLRGQGTIMRSMS